MRTKFCLAAVFAAATCTTAVALAQKAQTGNGAPSGSHYNLNIIGVPKFKNQNMDQGSGNVIFVGLGTNLETVTTKILLSQSADGSFQVLDKNGSIPSPG